MPWVARLRGWAPKRHQLLQLGAARRQGPVLEFQSGFPHGKRCANVDQLVIESMDDFLAGLPGHFWGWSVAGNDQPGNEQR